MILSHSRARVLAKSSTNSVGMAKGMGFVRLILLEKLCHWKGGTGLIFQVLFENFRGSGHIQHRRYQFTLVNHFKDGVVEIG